MNPIVALVSASLVSLSIPPASAAPEIAGGNGGFETNTFTNPGFAGIQNLWETTAGTASGWTFTGTGRWFMRNDGANSGAPHDGEYFLNLALGEHGGFGFSATTPITGLSVGQTYAVEFYASKRIGTTAGVSFAASVDTLAPTNLSVTEANLPAITSGRANYAKQTLTFVATATTHTFTLSNAGTASSNGFLVDDFSVVPVIVPDLPPGTLADYNEVWTTPGTSSWESMPLGNGETSLNAWVEGNGDLLFYIGRSDAESEGNLNLKLGRVRLKLTPNPFTAGLPFNQTLDLATGRILITAGNPGSQTRLQVWVDAHHPVIRVAGDSDTPVSVEASYEMDLRGLNSAAAIADAHQGDYVLNDGSNAVTFYHRNRASAFQTNLSSEGLSQSLATVQDPIMNRTFGGRMSGTGMTRSGAQKIVKANTTTLDLAIDVHAGVYPAAAQWKTDLDALAAARASRSPVSDLAAHQSWWSAFWNRSYLHMGGTGDEARRISKYYAHQRFINACTLRGRYPTPFNGSTLTMDRPAGYPSFFGTGNAARNADYRDWNGLRIFWQNTRHIYWPLLTSGDYDLTESVARVARDILPVCRERASVRENNPGMLLFEGIGVGGDTVFGSNVPDHLSEHRGGMTDVAILLGDIYDHTRDETFFTGTYLPWASDVVKFFEYKFPGRDASGKMLFSPSAAVETYKNSTNPSTEVGPLRRILSDLLRLDPGTLSPAQRDHYRGLLDIMPEPPLKNVLNQPMLGIYQTGSAGRSLVETPSLYSVWPSRLSGLGRPAWLAAGRRDMASRMYSFDGTAANSDPTYESGGWLYTPTVAAQLNLPQQAKFYALRNFLNPIPDTVGNGTVVLPNPYPGKPRFHAFWESRFDYIPDQCHGGSTTIGLQHMVVQSHGDKIHLLPAWPEEWDLNFKVHAARNTVLEGVYQNGVLQSLTVTPPSRAADVIDMSTAANRIRGIVGTCVADTNFLLGLPPMRDGLPVIPAATVSPVTGAWFTQYGHTLGGGLAGPFIATGWGGSMAKGNSIFIHVLEWPGETLTLPALALGRQITGNAVLTGGSATVNQSATGVSITLPAADRDPVDTIIRLDLDGSAEALARHQPYIGSCTTGMTASASTASAGFEAAKACDADQTTSWRHGATSGTLTIPLGGNRRLTRIDVQFDNGASLAGQNISVTLEAQSSSGSWNPLWSGTSYTQILSRPLVPVVATAVRLTTNAQGVRQLDAFSEALGYHTWDNGAATGNWNSTDANWTGSTWNNSTPDNAVFDSTTGTITLTEPITAGTFTFGLPTANTTGAFAGSALAISGNLVARADGNNGPGVHTLSFSNNVTVGGDVRIGRRVLEVTGGNFTASRFTSLDSWGRLLVSGGTVILSDGIDDSVLSGGNTLSVFLQGGSLYTPYIKTTSAAMIFNYVGPDGVVLNGGTLFATADSSDFIQTWTPPGWTNRNDIGVGTGGANINTNGFDITITKVMKDSGGTGALTKSGEGTLTLTAANSYSGPTTVNSGTLSLGNGVSNGNLHDASSVIVASGATLHLNYSGTDTVKALSFAGIARPPGVYSAANSLFITGTGTLTVSTGPAGTPTAISNIAGNKDVGLPFSLGHVFTVSQTVDVTAMGQFDVLGNGAVGTAKVALYNWDTGAKLSETTLSGATLEETGFYDTHFVNITPITLSPGSRYLLAAEVAANDFVFGNGIITFDPAIQWEAGRATPVGSPAMPATANGSTFSIERTAEASGSYFGPNLKLASATPLSGIALTSPGSRSIYQRTASNVGTITLSGTYTGSPSEIQARAVVMTGSGNSGNSTDWQAISTAPSAGSFSGSLGNVAAGGWYQIEVRSVIAGVPGTATVLQKVGVGDIYVTCGQSNSANYGQGGYSAGDDRVCARTSVTGSNWILAADPLPIAGGSGGSVWTRLGDLLAAQEDIPIGFIAVGVGSTQVGEWVPGTSNYNNLLKPALQSFPANGFRAVLWHQGESDAIANTSAATYASRLNSVIAQSRIDAAWSVPWYVAEASFHPSTTLSQEEPVTAGQRLVIQADPLVFLGSSTDGFHLEDANGGKLVDTVHFNNAGLLDHAGQWRDILRGTTSLNPRNGSFEENRASATTGSSLLADNASHIVNTGTDTDSPLVLGWRILSASGNTVADGSNGFFNPSSGTYAGAVDTANGGVLPNMEGRHVAMLDGGSPGNGFLQSTRAIARARTKYTLTVAIGVRDNPAGFGIIRPEIVANGAVVASVSFDKAALDALHGGDASGAFTDASVSWTTGASVPANQPLAIRIVKEGGAGTVIDFDKVRLTSAPANDFSAWIGNPAFALNPADQGFDVDPDGDNLTNGIEAWFGTNPGESNAGISNIASDGTTTVFTHPQNSNPPDNISVFYRWSPDLVTWYAANGLDGPPGGAAVAVSPVTVGSTTTLTATTSEALPRLFLQAEVVQAP